jgi:hypothetical protein
MSDGSMCHHSLELHHLTSSGILHFAGFVTLCEAYMGIEPHINLWNHFFHVHLLQCSGAEVAILGGADIYIKFGNEVDPYFDLPMSESTDGWWKVWFILRNDADAPLPVFTGSRPVAQPNW